MDDDGATLYGSLPENGASRLSACVMALLMELPSARFAVFNLAAINCSARMMLASPTTELSKMDRSSVFVYDWLPSVSVFTGHVLAWFFQ